MIHIILGTKAQYLKMIPVIQEFEREAIPYTIIDTGQHSDITEGIRSTFGIREPDLFLSPRRKGVSTIGGAFFWNARIFTAGSLACRKVVARDDRCIVHGDTLSTLQGAFIAKVCRARLVHIEAGERTYNIAKPFPEEIVRRVVDRFSDLCFAASDQARDNLAREKIRGEVVNVRHNTILDTAELAGSLGSQVPLPDEYALVSIHRTETVYSKKRMETIVDTVSEIAEQTTVIWGLHEVTEKRLAAYNLLHRLRSSSDVLLRGLFDYPSFIKAIRGANFLITDGGGPQEESYFLNTPCLLMRTETERGSYGNICLSKFEKPRITAFIREYKGYRMPENPQFESPSHKIAAHLKNA